MNRKSIIIVASAIGLATIAGLTIAGPLEPTPGPIAPTMKTLHEVEPRIAISTANTPGDANSQYLISQPGSYYLTGNINGVTGKHGIKVAAPNVTIDLNGFVMKGASAGVGGVGASLTGIKGTEPAHNVSVRNGVVCEWGESGLDLLALLGVVGGVVEHVVAADNGEHGFRVASNSIIRYCTARGNAASGIGTGVGVVIERCTARDNGSIGISASDGCAVSDCTAIWNVHCGIFVSIDGSIHRCAATYNQGDGIAGSHGTHIEGCTAGSNTEDGIQVRANCTVMGNTCRGNQSAGIRVLEGENRIEKNNVTDNGVGIDLDAPGNIAISNTARSNVFPFIFPAGNTTGPLVNGGTGPITATNPYCNFAF